MRLQIFGDFFLVFLGDFSKYRDEYCFNFLFDRMENLIHIHSEETFQKEIENSDFVFVDFFADRCGPCQLLSPIIEKLATQYPHWKFLKINVDEVSALAEKYQIYSIPALFLFQQGEIKDQFVGALPYEELEKKLLACEQNQA